jgi:hypothetical protein
MRCYNCKQEGHSADTCEQPLVCPRCRASHLLKDCPEPMLCNICGKEGHLAKSCEDAPPRVCNNCQEEGMSVPVASTCLVLICLGHEAVACKNPRRIDFTGVRDVDSKEALRLIHEAVCDKDLDDVKAAVRMFSKADPEMTYVDLEQRLRSEKIELYLIGIEKPLLATLTNMDLQGNLDKKYTITYRWEKLPRRPRDREFWPQGDEDNYARLSDGGEIVPRGIPKCSNCEELGHVARNCSQERMENTDRAEIKCVNCDEVGHRMRDCECTPRNSSGITDENKVRLQRKANLLVVTVAMMDTLLETVSSQVLLKRLKQGIDCI